MDGTENSEASRRVEFLFTLKDEDMIREMIEILNEQENAPSASEIINAGPTVPAETEASGPSDGPG